MQATCAWTKSSCYVMRIRTLGSWPSRQCNNHRSRWTYQNTFLKSRRWRLKLGWREPAMNSQRPARRSRENMLRQHSNDPANTSSGFIQTTTTILNPILVMHRRLRRVNRQKIGRNAEIRQVRPALGLSVVLLCVLQFCFLGTTYATGYNTFQSAVDWNNAVENL